MFGKKHAAPQAHGTKAVNPIKPVIHQVCFKAVDDQGKPLASIEFEIQDKKKKKHTGKTGAQGRYLITKVPEGDVKVLSICGGRMYECLEHTVEKIVADPDAAGKDKAEIEVAIRRDKAKKYTVAADDTLASIIKKPDVKLSDWEDLAWYNWGTEVKDEVNRALIECIGCSEVNEKNPSKTVLEPPKGETRELLIFKPWTSAELGKDLELDKMHVFKLKPITPANAVSIPTLDQWFIPALESCDIQYQLEGLKDYADKVDFQVYGSNYCKCTDWNKGLGKYTALPDTPLFVQAGNSASERKQGEVLTEDPKTKKKGRGWKGQVSTGEGILGVKPKDKERYINVAFSPYSAVLRYYIDAGDKTAALIALPFWPQWEETKSTPVPVATEGTKKITIKWDNADKADRGSVSVKDGDDQVVYGVALGPKKLGKGAQQVKWDKKYGSNAWNTRLRQEFVTGDPYTYEVVTAVLKPKADSLKAEWLVKNTDRLERGLLLIFDGNDQVVFRAPIPKAKLAKSADDNDKRSITWDGKYAKGVKNSKKGDSIIPEDMPYRIEIQGHTGVNEPKGLALAVKHTEVRLAVAPNTLDPADPAYCRERDGVSIGLGLGPIHAGDTPTDETKDLWVQFKLAEAGYHPGPVLGKNHAQYKLALQEFQRSVPVTSADPKKKWDRLTVSGAVDDKTRGAIRTLDDKYRRPKFGNPADKGLASHADKSAGDWEAIGKIVRHRNKGLIVWVDTRHYYTETAVEQALVSIGDYHGAFQIGDGLEAQDNASTCRPWIPLAALLRLLSKDKGLTDALDAPDPKNSALLRSLIGPLRVDWTFDEIGPDLSHIDTTTYSKKRVRTLRDVQWCMRALAETHQRKDLQHKVLYTNAPENNGGIRGAVADYYKAALGYGDNESLWPWQGVPDSAADREGIATVIHDHLLSTQPKDTEPLYDDWRGRAGVYFRPSIVAGDGYRVRAQVVFAAAGTDYQFPNLDALAKRYPRLPQAHTAAFRVWRRSSVRGYLRWAAAGPGADDPVKLFAGMNLCYHTAHVHFVAETAAVDTDFKTYVPTDLIDAKTYKDLITARVINVRLKTNTPDIIKFSNDYCYPWYDENDLGWPDASLPGPDVANATKLIDTAQKATWARFQEGLLLTMVQGIEAQDGKMRGHLLATFKDTPDFWVRQYVCQKVGCGKLYWYMEKTKLGKLHAGANCPAACGGTLSADQCRGKYECTSCHAGPFYCYPDTSPNGGSCNGGQCPTCHAAALQITGHAAGYVVAAPRSIVNYGIGNAGGGTWLFKGMPAWQWAHEVGHHRHLEHAADAPVGGLADQQRRDRLHDYETNTTAAGFQISTAALNQRWDRCCVMSYVHLLKGKGDLAADPNLDRTCFCGKCVLRNAGWKVETIKDSTNLDGPGGGANDD